MQGNYTSLGVGRGRARCGTFILYRIITCLRLLFLDRGLVLKLWYSAMYFTFSSAYKLRKNSPQPRYGATQDDNETGTVLTNLVTTLVAVLAAQVIYDYFSRI